VTWIKAGNRGHQQWRGGFVNQSIIKLSLLAGIRTEEARALRWDDVVVWVDDASGRQPVLLHRGQVYYLAHFNARRAVYSRQLRHAELPRQ
jgi:integrase